MSVGNLNTQGNKKNNFPYQLAVLKLLDAINNSVNATASGFESRTTFFQAIAAGAGYSIGDIIVRYDIIDTSTSTIVSTIWFNQTTQSTIAAPIPADLIPVAGATTVNVNNGGGALAVNIQDGGNSITVDSSALDVLLSTRNAEATQLLIHALLTTIDGDTSNLDVLLSTRASEATLLTRATEATLLALSAKFNTLGQKPSASSTPVVLSTEQEVILDAIKTAVEAIDIDTNGLSLEATQLLVLAMLTTIDADTSNLDVLLSTRASEATLSTLGTEATLLTRLSKADFEARINTLGQKLMAASTPVVIASDQSAIPVTGPLTDAQLRATPVPISAAALPLPTGAATAALQTQPGVDIGDVTVNNGAGAAAVNIQDGGNSITVDGTVSVSNFPATQPVSIAATVAVSAATLPLPTGAATAANQATANASLASIDAGIPAALGQTTMAASMPVTIASDQTVLTTTPQLQQTYSATILGLVPAALATDIFTITGSATKTVKLRFVRVTATRTASSTSDIVLVKRSTANTGGTSTAPTVVPHDSANAAGTATILAYTANPILGTLVGNMRNRKMFINAAGAGISDVTEYAFASEGAQVPTLRGIAQVIGFNLNGVTITGGSFDIVVVWTEE